MESQPMNAMSESGRRHPVRRRGLLWALVTITSIVLLATTAFAGSNSTTLPRGADLTVSIDSPLTGWEFLIPTGDAGRDVTIDGTASIGQGEPDATFVYVLDGSGSTALGSGTGCSPILGCEKVFFTGLNAAVIANGSADEAGLVVFGEGAVIADMTPGGGDDPLTDPNAGPGDVNTVINSADSNGGVGQFTAKSSGGNGTNFSAAVAAATTVVGASSNSVNIVVFVSDGGSNMGGGTFAANLAALAGTGAVVYTVAIGTGNTCATGSDGTLQQIADATGGTCSEIVDPGDLPSIIPDLISTSLDALYLEVDSGGQNAIPNSDIDPDLPVPGPASVTYSTVAPGLAPGDHLLCVTAEGSDGAGSATVTQCEAIGLFQLSLAPDGVVNELGTPGQDHTVDATLAGPALDVGGRDIEFSITAGPNAGTSGTDQTDTGGVASFTYVAVQGPAGLGTDTIQACVTLNDPLGETGCTTVTKAWVDTTPPVAMCLATVNPHGEQIPVAPGQGGQGQNQDGFYQLDAFDAVWPAADLDVYLLDTGSGTVFGPFAVGTRIKYVEAPGAPPSQKAMGGGTQSKATAVDWLITGTGDAQIYAVDGSGNESDPADASCLVPPPPM